MLAWICSSDHLEPQFRSDIEELLGSSAYNWHCMYGYRTIAEQAALYQKHLDGGPLAAPPGHSAHNFGLAVDLQLIVGGKAIWDTSDPGWAWLFAAVKAHPRLHSGVSFGDSDHVERYHWTQYKDWNTNSEAA